MARGRRPQTAPSPIARPRRRPGALPLTGAGGAGRWDTSRRNEEMIQENGAHDTMTSALLWDDEDEVLDRLLPGWRREGDRVLFDDPWGVTWRLARRDRSTLSLIPADADGSLNIVLRIGPARGASLIGRPSQIAEFLGEEPPRRGPGVANAAGGRIEVRHTVAPPFRPSVGWYRAGRLHRTDGGPALITTTKGDEWYVDGKRHREDGPAVIGPDGSLQWWRDGKRHREDGPAVVSEQRTEYYRKGKLHRDGGPALITPHTEAWYRSGKLHREDGPAQTSPRGTTERWAIKGRYHRTDGPAITERDKRCWYIDGNLHRTDGPAIEWTDGGREWYREGALHRDGAPAVALADGTHRWYQAGVLHREDGPAVTLPDGTHEWWVRGEQLSHADFLRRHGQRATGSGRLSDLLQAA